MATVLDRRPRVRGLPVRPSAVRPLPPPSEPGSTVVGSLDLSTVGDRFKFQEALRRRWPMSGEMKERCFAALDLIVRREMAKETPDAAAVLSATRCLLIEQEHALEDLHRQEDRELRTRRPPPGQPTPPLPSTIDYDALHQRLLGAG